MIKLNGKSFLKKIKIFAEKIELTYFEVSAKTNQRINEGISYNNAHEILEEEEKYKLSLKIKNQLNNHRLKYIGKGKKNKNKTNF